MKLIYKLVALYPCITFFTLFFPQVDIFLDIKNFCEYICTLISFWKHMGLSELIGWILEAHTFAAMLTVFGLALF